jgi:hypothetical protein
MNFKDFAVKAVKAVWAAEKPILLKPSTWIAVVGAVAVYFHKDLDSATVSNIANFITSVLQDSLNAP